jgi:hypothetical protein
MYSDCQRTFIDDSNYAAVLKDMMVDLNIRDVPRAFRFDNIKSIVALADWLSMWMCSQINDGLRLCTDVVAVRRIDDCVFTDRGPYMWRNGGIADYAITYSNNSPKYFRDKLKCRAAFGRYSVPLEFMDGTTNTIPNEYFRHLSCENHSEEHWQKLWDFDINK